MLLLYKKGLGVRSTQPLRSVDAFVGGAKLKKKPPKNDFDSKTKKRPWF